MDRPKQKKTATRRSGSVIVGDGARQFKNMENAIKLSSSEGANQKAIANKRQKRHPEKRRAPKNGHPLRDSRITAQSCISFHGQKTQTRG